jgi:hypothetical protein
MKINLFKFFTVLILFTLFGNECLTGLAEELVFSGQITRTYSKSKRIRTLNFKARIHEEKWNIKTFAINNDRPISYQEAGSDGVALCFVTMLNQDLDPLLQVDIDIENLRLLRKKTKQYELFDKEIESLEKHKLTLLKNKIIDPGTNNKINVATGLIDYGKIPIVDESSLIAAVWFGLCAGFHYQSGEIIEIHNVFEDLNFDSVSNNQIIKTVKNSNMMIGEFILSDFNEKFFSKARFSNDLILYEINNTIEYNGDKYPESFTILKKITNNEIHYRIDCKIDSIEFKQEEGNFLPDIPGRTSILDKRFYQDNELETPIIYQIDEISGWPSVEIAKTTEIFKQSKTKLTYNNTNKGKRHLLIGLFIIISCSALIYYIKDIKTKK